MLFLEWSVSLIINLYFTAVGSEDKKNQHFFKGLKEKTCGERYLPKKIFPPFQADLITNKKNNTN